MKESWKIINQVLNKLSESTNINTLSTPDGGDRKKVEDSWLDERVPLLSRNRSYRKIEYTPSPLLSGDYNVNLQKNASDWQN